MSREDRNLKLQNAVLEWQKKYGIHDGDPMLAALELFHLCLQSHEPPSNGSRTPTFGEFRESIELLDQRTKSFTKLALELIQELRHTAQQSRQKHIAAVTIASLLVVTAFVAGVVVGRLPW